MRLPSCRVLRPLSALALILTSLSTATAWAQNYIVPTQLDLTANFNTIQVKLGYTGDDDRNAVVKLRYWKTADGDGFSDPGHDLVRDLPRSRFVGDVFWLEEGVGYTVEARIIDPTLVDDIYMQASITTRTTPPTPSGVTQVFVSPAGNDVTGDGSSGSPYATIQKAHDVLPAGGQIVLKAGIYWQTAQFTKNGSAAQPYSLVSESGPDSTIIDGSDVPMLSATNWTKVGTGNSPIYSIPYSYSLPNAEDSLDVVVAGWGQRLHRRTLLEQLTTTPPGYPVAGFFYDQANQVLYARLENGKKPGTQGNVMHVARRRNGLDVRGTNWIIDGITVRFANKQGIILGGYTAPVASGSVVRNSNLYTNGWGNVFGNLDTDECLVENCTLWDSRVDSWGYLPCKAHKEEQQRAVVFVGRGWTVRGNTVWGVFDGIQCGGTYCEPLRSSDSDVHDNVILNVADDGFEFDNTGAILLAAWRNVIQKANFGFSPNPQYFGPMYFLYNTVVNFDQGGVKNGAACNPSDPCNPCNSNGVQFYYQNTFTTSGYGTAVWAVGGTYRNKHHANNIFVGARPTVPPPYYVAVYDNGDAAAPGFFSFDYDLVWLKNPPSGGEFWGWGGYSYSSTSQLFSGGPGGIPPALGFEEHGVHAAPTFADSANGDYAPASGSPAIDMGRLIDGINTSYWTTNQVAMYSGSAPDAGAVEYVGGASPNRLVRSAAIRPVRLVLTSANPAHGEARFSLQIPAKMSVEVAAFDLSGRRVQTIADGEFAAGTHALTWRASGPVSAAGLYWIRARWAGGETRQRVVFLP